MNALFLPISLFTPHANCIDMMTLLLTTIVTFIRHVHLTLVSDSPEFSFGLAFTLGTLINSVNIYFRI